MGAVMLVASLAVTVYAWYYGYTHGRVFSMWILIPPAFVMISIGLLLFPMDVDKLEREHGVDRVQEWKHLPTPWRVILALAFLAAVANHYFVTGTIF